MVCIGILHEMWAAMTLRQGLAQSGQSGVTNVSPSCLKHVNVLFS